MSCSSWTSRSSSEASFGIGVSLRCVLRASAQNYPGYAVPLRVLRHLHTSLRSAPTPRAQPSAPGGEHRLTEASCSKRSRRRRETRRGCRDRAVAAIATVEALAATAAPDGLCAPAWPGGLGSLDERGGTAVDPAGWGAREQLWPRQGRS